MSDLNTSGDKAAIKVDRRWWHWAFAASVALNLLVGGWIVGKIIGHEGARDGMVRDLGFGVFSDALSKEEKQALRQSFFTKAPEFRQARKQMRTDMEALLAALRADPFNSADLEEKLDQQNTRIAAQLALGQQLIRDLLVKMTPEARLAFADRLEDRLRHGPGDRVDKGKAPPKPAP